MNRRVDDQQRRHSPLHERVAALRPEWRKVGGAPLALRIGDADQEREASLNLALCDVSGFCKVGVKGGGAERLLAGYEAPIPRRVYDSDVLSDGGFIVRLGADEFFLESGVGNEHAPRLSALTTAQPADAFVVDRADATILLVGTRSPEVLAQTCGVDVRAEPARRLIMTRVAGVSCNILPELSSHDRWRLWCDPSHAIYLWDELTRISGELGGGVVGAGCLFPDW